MLTVFATTRFLRFRKRDARAPLEVGILSKKHRSVAKWLGRHVADNFADLAAGQGEGYGLLGIRQILRAKKAVKDLSRTNTRVQSTPSDVQPSIVARLSGEGVVPWMGHALEADMGSNTKETRVDVSPYFVALTFLL